MRIGLDARTVCTAEVTGIGKYVLRLVEGLHTRHHLVLFSDRPAPSQLTLPTNNIVWVIGRAPRRWWWETRSLPKLLRKHAVDIYHATWNYGVPSVAIPTITTIHDVIPLALPSLYQKTPRQRLAMMIYRHFIQQAVQRSSAILTDSQSTAQDLATLFPFCTKKIRTIHLGCDTISGNAQRTTLLRRQFSLPGPYIVYYGGFEARKNVESLMRVFQNTLRLAFPELQLVLIGFQNGYFYSRIARSLGPGVVVTGYLAHQDLFSLVSEAATLVYPSRYEGFGLPVLEGLALGVPVVTTNVSSIPEIAGSAAVLVDPDNDVALADAICHVLKDASLRRRLADAGPRQAQKFSWKSTVAMVENAYRAAVDAR